MAFIFWFVQVKLPQIGTDNEKVDRRIARMRRKREMEAMNSSRRQSKDANQSLSMSVIQEEDQYKE